MTQPRFFLDCTMVSKWGFRKKRRLVFDTEAGVFEIMQGDLRRVYSAPLECVAVRYEAVRQVGYAGEVEPNVHFSVRTLDPPQAGDEAAGAATTAAGGFEPMTARFFVRDMERADQFQRWIFDARVASSSRWTF